MVQSEFERFIGLYGSLVRVVHWYMVWMVHYSLVWMVRVVHSLVGYVHWLLWLVDWCRWFNFLFSFFQSNISIMGYTRLIDLGDGLSINTLRFYVSVRLSEVEMGVFFR